ncbi:AMP-binding protein [Actinomadura litoris]|uniref:AMP-binding protein n=1 Tax=Actinomadura litoris TaxID=2678616 RepID=A0A7K1KVI1_9ACTN|nr:AMP-binding protein [Actinomadura litoris]MUN36123.1 AMP-binding protein [Actinomadura litoris]
MWPSSQRSRPWRRWYQPGVPTEITVPDVPLTRLLDDAAERYPRRPALIFYGRRIGYRELRDAADRFADGLHRLGVQPGDRVALVLPNCPQQVIAFFGVLRRAAVAVPQDPRHTPEEMRLRLADCGARVAVVVDRSYPTVRSVRNGLPLEQVVVTSLADYLPAARRAAARARTWRERAAAEVPDGPGVIAFRELQRPAWRVRQLPVEPARDLAVIQYTGGDEGRPRGAMLTHRNLVANACQQRAWDPGGRPGRDVTLGVLPLFHSFGLMSCLVAPVLAAGAVVLVPRFEPGQVLAALRRHRPTIVPGVPALYDRMIDSPGFRPSDLRSARVLISGAAGLGRATAERLERLGARGLIQCYGLTEASPAVAANPLGDTRRRSGPGGDLPVGLPLPMTDAVVVDAERPTRILPPGEAGELVVRGPQVFAGYWNAPLATARVLSKGWLRTGDIAVMDEDGFLTLLDRHRDLIKVNGFSVVPAEVEGVLRRHPAVHECAVVGVPDARRGERVVAYVVEHPAYLFSADELRRHCERHLSRYKVPGAFVPRADLPRDERGKVVRRRLRDEAAGPVARHG